MAPAKTKLKARKARRAKPAPPVTGHAIDVSLGDLLFDRLNPRLPEELTDRSPDSLLRYIATEYHPIEIARSIAAHGYFPSEPLIVLQQGGGYVAVEGNRRLAALKLLKKPEDAARLELPDSEEWHDIAEHADVPEQIPCILAASRGLVAPIIGYRHISGIEPWDPWAKARFLAGLVDADRLSFEKAASDVGETARTVREAYRNFRVTKQSAELGVDTARVRASFGVFTRAMQEPRLRSFIGAVPATDVERGTSALASPDTAKPRLQEFISWLFGTKDAEPLFTDSRKLSELAQVVANKPALKELRATRNLEAAFSLTGGVRDRLIGRLSKAAGLLEAARQDFPEYSDDPDVISAVERCQEGLAALQ